jgi:hypothetical protein
MRRDLARLERDPNDDDAAWDFFIEAEHIRHWTGRYRGTPPGIEPLDTMWQLANKAKHFKAENRKPRRVQATGRRGAFQPDAFDPRAFDTERLVVELDNPPEIKTALDLAREAVAFWEKELRRATAGEQARKRAPSAVKRTT